MKTLIMLLMFISAFLIISGIHDQRLESANRKKKIVYRYIPRSALDEQYYGTQASAHFQGMFTERKSPWMGASTPEEEGKQSFDFDRRVHANPVNVGDRRVLGGGAGGGAGGGTDSDSDYDYDSEHVSDSDSDSDS